MTVSRRERLKQGQDAKQRVLSGMYDHPQETQAPAPSGRLSRLKSSQPQPVPQMQAQPAGPMGPMGQAPMQMSPYTPTTPQPAAQMQAQPTQSNPGLLMNKLTPNAELHNPINIGPKIENKGALGSIKTGVNHVFDVLSGIRSGATFGLSDYADKKIAEKTGLPENTHNDNNYRTAGEFVGSAVLPGSAVGHVAQVATAPIKNAATRIVARGALGGGLYGVAREGAEAATGQNNQTLGQRAQDVGIDTAFGIAADVGLSAAGKGLSALYSRLRSNGIPDDEIADILALPMGTSNRSAREAAAADRLRGGLEPGTDPITPEYQFKLDEPSQATRTNNIKVDMAQTDLGRINQQIADLENGHAKAIIDEYKYLRDSMKNREGVEMGNLIRNEDGDVIDRYGFTSKNPRWYQEAFAEKNRKPSYKRLYQLAEERVNNGFHNEDGTFSPSWKEQNNVDEALKSLQQVRDQLRASVREASNNHNITDTPLVSRENAFTRAGKETEQPTAANIPPEPMQAATVPQQAPTNAPTATQPVRTATAEAAATSELPAPYTGPVAEPVIRQQPAPGERALYSNVESTEITPELRGKMSESERRFYERMHNADTVEKAAERVGRGLSKAASYARSGNLDAEKVATGFHALRELQKAGRFDEAAELVDDLAAKLTKAGQAIQAASLVQRLSPEGQLVRIQRRVSQLNEKLPEGKKITLSPETTKTITETAEAAQAAGISEDRAGEVLQITEKLRAGNELTVEEQQTLQDFAADLQTFIGESAPDLSPSMQPREMRDPRKRDKLVSWLDGKAQEAQQRLNARRNSLSANPFDVWVDMGIVAASKMAKRSVQFGDFSAAMLQQFGEQVRPYLQHAFDQGKKLLGREAARSKDSAKRAAADAERAAKKQTAEEMVLHTRRTIDRMREGKATPDDIEALRNAANNVNAIMGSPKATTEDKQLMQAAKQLARKLDDAERETTPKPESVKEIERLIRKLDQIAQEGKPVPERIPVDNSHIEKLAYELHDRAVPGTAEKIAIKFLRENKQLTESEIDNIREISQSVSRLKGKERIDSENELNKILNSYEKSSLWDKVNILRYIAMLWNTGTQTVNAVSGPLMATKGWAADLLPVMVDKAMSATLGTPRHVTLYGANPVRFIGQWLKNAHVGARAGWHGINPDGIAGTNDVKGLVYKGKNPISAIPSFFERSLGAVAKGADYGTYKTMYNAELRRSGWLEARNRGLRGKDLDRAADNFIANPTQDAMIEADRIARNATFQRTDSVGGGIASGLAGMKGKAGMVAKPLVSTVFPFIRTPVNIMEEAVNLTPAGVLRGLFQLSSKSEATTREALRTLGTGIVGTAGLGVLGFELSRAGIITGANDSGNKDVDAIRDQAGRGKYRFNMSAMARYTQALVNGEGFEAAERAAKYQKGDKQFNYNKFQPLAFPLATGAALQERSDQGTAQQVGGAVKDAAGSLLGMSSLKGMQQVLQPEYGGTQGEAATGIISRVGESFLKSFSPSTLAQEARREDPIQRKTSFNNGIIPDTVDYFKSRTPGLSQQLPAARTTLGQIKGYNDGVTGQYLNPYQSDVAPYTEAAAFIADLIDRTGDETLAPSAPDKKISGKDVKTHQHRDEAIPPERYAQLQQEVGDEIIKRIGNIDRSLSDDAKIEKVKKIYDDVNTLYRNRIKREMGIVVTK